MNDPVIIFIFGFTLGVLFSIYVYRQPSGKSSNTADLHSEAVLALKEQMQYQTIQNVIRQQQTQQAALENEFLELSADRNRLKERNLDKHQLHQMIKSAVSEVLE